MNKNLDLKEIFKVAIENHRNGKLVLAEKLYIKILDNNPNHFKTLFSLFVLQRHCLHKVTHANLNKMDMLMHLTP